MIARHFVAAQHLVVSPLPVGVERHELDEPQLQAVLAGEVRQAARSRSRSARGSPRR